MDKCQTGDILFSMIMLPHRQFKRFYLLAFHCQNPRSFLRSEFEATNCFETTWDSSSNSSRFIAMLYEAERIFDAVRNYMHSWAIETECVAR